MSGDRDDADDYEESQAAAEFVGPDDDEIPQGPKGHPGDMWPGRFKNERGEWIVNEAHAQLFRDVWERESLGIVFPEDVLPEEERNFWDAVAEGKIEPSLLDEMGRLTDRQLRELSGVELRSLHLRAIESLGSSN